MAVSEVLDEENVEGLRSGTGTTAPIVQRSHVCFPSGGPFAFSRQHRPRREFRPYHLQRHLQNQCGLVALNVLRLNLAVGVDVRGIPKLLSIAASADSKFCSNKSDLSTTTDQAPAD